MLRASAVNTEFSGALPWQLPVFGGSDAPGYTADKGPKTAAELEDVEATAYREGYARGQREGYAAGLTEARRIGSKLQALMDHLTRPMADLDAEVERTLTALAIEMARRLAHLEMDLDPSRVAGVVREAVTALGSTPRELRIHLHPEDVEAVRSALTPTDDAAGWKLIADRELNRGDCRIVADGARVDARLDSRQAALAQALLGEPA